MIEKIWYSLAMTKSTKTLFVTGFTRATKYQELSQRLIASFNEFGLNYLAMSFDPKETWEQNCSLKPSIIQKAMSIHDGPVVWIDADAELVSYPYELLSVEESFDFAARSEQGEKGNVIFSGTVWVSGSDTSKSFVQEWISQCDSNPNQCDQTSLLAVADRYARANLTAQSCYISELDGQIDSPCVYHHPTQHSKSHGLSRDVEFYKDFSAWLSTVATDVNIDGQSTDMSRFLSLYMDLSRNPNGAVAVDAREIKDAHHFMIDQLHEWVEQKTAPQKAAFMLDHAGEKPTVLDVKNLLNGWMILTKQSKISSEQIATSIPGASLWLFDFSSANHEATTVP
tara:strand:- start:400 stop:1419 length:1020 start_codon:yes stop_codon:yes gene_type:complete